MTTVNVIRMLWYLVYKTYCGVGLLLLLVWYFFIGGVEFIISLTESEQDSVDEEQTE